MDLQYYILLQEKVNAEICNFLFESLDDKNPVDEYGDTPLHNAAVGGSLDVFKLIFESVTDKNPRFHKL